MDVGCLEGILLLELNCLVTARFDLTRFCRVKGWRQARGGQKVKVAAALSQRSGMPNLN